MKKISFTAVLLVASILFFAEARAQSKEFENVIEVKLQNTVTIKNNKAIVGYALFYKVDKLKKAALYRLEILDENLKSIGNNEFEGSKELELIDAIYESGNIMLAFNDPKKVDDYEKFVMVFDLKGKQKGLVSYDPDRVKKGMFGAAIADQMERYYNGYNNVEGKGFICVYQSKAKVGGVNMQMISTDGKLKWEKNMEAAKGDRMDAYLTATTPNAIIFFVAEREGVMQKDAKNFLVGLDPDNGKELFRKSMEFSDLAWEPMLFKADNSNNLKMISMLSHEEDKFYTANPIGLNIASLNDKTGEIKVEKNFLYDTDLSGVLNMKSESKSEDGFLKIHDLCIMADGSKVIVGEFFRRTVSAVGMAGKLLSRGSSSISASQISIGDMFLMHLDANNKPVSLDKIEKDVSRVPGVDGVSIGLLARVMGLEGNFGYMYTDELADPSKKTVVAEGEFDGDKYGTVAITFDEKKGFKAKKFNIEKEKKERVFLRRAKPGHILVMKYNKKEKKIALNLERID